MQGGELQRYGFHGISCSYLMTELTRLGDPAATRGRVVLAHLGNGASVTAVRNGHSIDTSMGFTPASGLMMGTRTGDIDPGIFYYLSARLGMTPEDIQRMVNHTSGLLGVSERSADVRELLAHEGADSRSAEALSLFCYQAKKWIGAMAAALGGIDTLVFSGGIGENAASVRARICDDLAFLGIRLDFASNAASADIISVANGAVSVRVVHTDEELMIAREVCRRLS
jgi:acetate kinase